MSSRTFEFQIKFLTLIQAMTFRRYFPNTTGGSCYSTVDDLFPSPFSGSMEAHLNFDRPHPLNLHHR
jgi:hypothetical protein